MKNFLFLFLSFAVLTACSSDDSSSTNSTTKAVLILKSTTGTPVSNVVVYAYDEINWELIGDETQFADFQASSDSEGKATFNNIFTNTTFYEINNFTNTFRFSAHYTLNGVDKTKVVAITFKKGESKAETITLN